jgi:hypothetical protein
MARYVLIFLALAIAVLGQAQQPVATVHDKEASESAEHKYAQQKFDEATKRCVGLLAEYEALELKIATVALKGSSYSVPESQPVATTCAALKERSALQLKDATQHNELIEQEHKDWADHAIKMIALGRKPGPETHIGGQPVPLDMLRQLNALTETHDRIASELPTLESRLKHADECVAVYKKTIDEKVADLTTRESEQIKACMALGLYPPDK